MHPHTLRNYLYNPTSSVSWGISPVSSSSRRPCTGGNPTHLPPATGFRKSEPTGEGILHHPAQLTHPCNLSPKPCGKVSTMSLHRPAPTYLPTSVQPLRPNLGAEFRVRVHLPIRRTYYPCNLLLGGPHSRHPTTRTRCPTGYNASRRQVHPPVRRAYLPL